MIEIVQAQSEDLSIIQALAQEIWWPTYGDFLSAAQIEYMLERMYSMESLTQQAREGHVFALAKHCEKQEVFGFVGYRLVNGESDQTSKVRIEKLYVLPAAQGLQLGSKMIQYVSDFARLNNCTLLELNVNRYNSAVHFYQKQGFQIIETLDIPYGPFLLNDYLMLKHLDA